MPELTEQSIQAEIKAAIENTVPKEEGNSEPNVDKQLQSIETPQISDMEVLASKHGWNNKGEKSADDYVEYALTHLSAKNSDMKQMKTSVDALVSLNAKKEQAGYDRAIAELNDSRNQAITDGDIEEVNKLDTEIQETTQNHQPNSNQEEISIAVSKFQERNKDWMTGTSYEDLEMQTFNIQRDELLMKRNLPVGEHLTILEEHVRAKFPDYFKPKIEAHASTTENIPMYQSVDATDSSGTAKQASKPKIQWSSLNQAQKEIGQALEDSKAMTKVQYLEQLQQFGEV